MRVLLSAAVSADGCLGDCSGQRLMLSTPGDWHEVHRLRSLSDAVLAGARTLRCDDSSLTVHERELRAERILRGVQPEPAKATLTASGCLRAEMRFFTAGESEKFVFTTTDLPEEVCRAATVIRSERITAAWIVTELEKRGLRRLMVEGGSSVLEMFLREGMADEFRLAVSKRIRVDDPAAPRVDPAWGLERVPRTEEEAFGMRIIRYTMRPDREEQDRACLHRAIELGCLSRAQGDCYRVGALVQTRDGEIFTGYTHETSPTHHAEQEAIAKALAAGAVLRGASIYSSMEPCSERRSEPESCSAMIIRHGFSRAVFALYEPDRYVACCRGALQMRQQGIEVQAYPDMGDRVRSVNGLA